MGAHGTAGMNDLPTVAVCRLGHRPGRDDRMTTHVGLTARALGADCVIYPENATDAAETVRDITDRFGGPFAVERVDSPRSTVSGWEGRVAHLTMYGLPVQDVEADVRNALVDDREPLLVVVGSEKVPFEIYERADWNVAVTNQPHSEVAGLAVLLDRLFEGRALEREWSNATRRVIPQATGKRVESVENRSGDEAS